MNSHFQIEKTVQRDQSYIFFLPENTEWPIGTPAEKVLTDSDNNAFVYVMDHEDGYRYIKFPEHVWPSLVTLLETGTGEAVLAWKDQEVVLPGLREELYALLFNIEGNNNYGEQFTTAVENVFRPILQEAGE